MKNKLKKLSTEVYEMEASLARQQLILEIMKDFGEYNSENSDGVDKMMFLVNILYRNQRNLRKKLDEFIPEFQKNCRILAEHCYDFSVPA